MARQRAMAEPARWVTKAEAVREMDVSVLEGSPGNWASTGTRRRSTWRLRAPHEPRSGRIGVTSGNQPILAGAPVAGLAGQT